KCNPLAYTTPERLRQLGPRTGGGPDPAEHPLLPVPSLRVDARRLPGRAIFIGLGRVARRYPRCPIAAACSSPFATEGWRPAGHADRLDGALGGRAPQALVLRLARAAGRCPG